MIKWKLSFFITLLVLLATNAFWFYTVIDVGVAHMYQQVSLDEKSKSVKMLGELIVNSAKKHTKNDILHILRQANKDAFIVEEENIISVEGISFIFINNKLAEIKG